MIKRKNAILIIFIYVMILGCKKTYTDVENLNLIGNVKEVSSIKYEAIEKFGKVEKGERVAVAESKYWEGFSDCSLVMFGEDKRLISESTYDEYGSLVYKIQYNEDTILDITSSEGELIGKKIRNHKWFPTEEFLYDSEGKLKFRNTFEYSDDKLLEANTFDREDNVLKKVEYKYNANGYCENKQTTEVESYRYRGRSSAPQIVKRESFEYDSNGNIISVRVEKGDNISKLLFRYKFDQFDNWVEKIEYVSSIPKFVTEREIKYYQDN